MSDHVEPQPAAPQPVQPKEEITFFAQTNFRHENRRFGIKIDDRRRHMYMIGKTGMGKSTLLENMIIQDIQNGKGVAVVDPHGDLVEKVINFVPSNRMNDVVYFNPADVDHPISFNILENVGDEYKNLVSNGLVGVFKKIWADSWGPRLEYILINAILALLEYPGSTLLGVTRMLVDPRYRKKVVHNITDPVVKSFWIDEYNNYTEKFRNEAIAPIQNKVGQFLSSSLIRNIVGQAKSTIDMRELMDSGKIVLMNLSKGRIGEENAALLGAMMITKIQLAAMSRVDIPETERRDFYLYVDEFQNFSTESFANILSEARKYRLNLIMAHQYIEQLSDEVKAAVFGNIGTLIAFRVGATDAEELEKEFQPTFMQEDVVTLPAHHVYLRLMIDGVASEPFSATTLPPISGATNQRDKVIQVSRERYAKDRASVEEKIRKWAGYAHGEGGEDDEDADDADDANARNERPKRPEQKPQRPERPDDRNRDRKGADRNSGQRPAGRDQRSGQAGKDRLRPVDRPAEKPANKPAAVPTVAAAPKSAAPAAVQAAPVQPPRVVESVVPKPPYTPVQHPVRAAQPQQQQPQPADFADLREKKLSFVQPQQPVQKPVPAPQQPQPPAKQPPVQSPQVTFHSLAEALPQAVEPNMPTRPAAPSQNPNPKPPVAAAAAPVTADGQHTKRRRRRRKKNGAPSVSNNQPAQPNQQQPQQPPQQPDQAIHFQ